MLLPTVLLTSPRATGSMGFERWSEGSRDDSVVFKLKDPGTYRFLIQGQAGAAAVAFPDADFLVVRPSGRS